MTSKRRSKKDDGEGLFSSGENKQEEARNKALESTLSDLDKRYGEGTIMRLGDAQHMTVETIPSGSLTLDLALGVGGLPRGRITEIYGPESSGKTTLCLHVVAEAQKRGGLTAFIDMEHALDPLYAARIGVDLNRLYVSQPDTGEQALEITESLVRSGALDVIVIDSVAALVPRAEIEGEMGDSFVGLQARLMSQALRKLSGAIKQSNVTVIFTNQIREKVGVMYGCFRGDTPITLSDGTTLPISEIVEKRLPVEVLSYNAAIGIYEPRRVVNWFNNGDAESFLRITTSQQTVVCTPNHLILCEDGYIRAEELKVGSRVMRASVMEMATPTGGASVSYIPEWVNVKSIETVDGDVSKYDLEVEGNHCYVAGGITVHNSPETQPGGRALKFYASVRLDIRRVQAIKQGGETIGNRTKVRVTKNKVAAPFREAEFDIMFYQNGISKVGEIVDLGVDLGIIDKKGAFFRYNDGLLGQGRENSKQYLLENPALAEEIEQQIRARSDAVQLASADDASGSDDE